jgi:hypothetical protein
MSPAFSETLMQKYPVAYLYCRACGLLKTEKPYWLKEAYQQAIAACDTGQLQRNIANSKMAEVMLHCLFRGKGRFLDVAGGHGILARLLRDMGFDCYSTDPYCRNLFAAAFEPEAGFRADALFAFEVVEHCENPREFLENSFAAYSCRTILLSTFTFSGAIPPKSWWYYAFDTGQHISFFQPGTLAFLAGALGCRYYRLGPAWHLITDKRLPALARLVLARRLPRKLYSLSLHRRRRRMSRTWSDHLQMKALSGSETEKKQPKS